jgi:hypothetical protein
MAYKLPRAALTLTLCIAACTDDGVATTDQGSSGSSGDTTVGTTTNPATTATPTTTTSAPRLRTSPAAATASPARRGVRRRQCRVHGTNWPLLLEFDILCLLGQAVLRPCAGSVLDRFGWGSGGCHAHEHASPRGQAPLHPLRDHLRLTPRFHPASASNGQESVFCPVPGRRRQGPSAPPRAHGSDFGADEARKEAMAILARRDDDASAGEPAPAAKTAATAPQIGPKSPTIREFACRFEHDHIDMYLKPRTAAKYRSTLRLYILPALGDRRLDEVSTGRRPALHNSLKTMPCAANYVRCVLSVMYSKAVQWELTTCRNPVTVRGEVQGAGRRALPETPTSARRSSACSRRPSTSRRASPATSAARRSGPCACWPSPACAATRSGTCAGRW